MSPLDTSIPDPAVVVLIGAAGAGKSSLAATWEPTQVLCLDQYRALVWHPVGDDDATGDAVFALQCVLEARMERRLTSVIDATNTTVEARIAILKAAARYSQPTVALLVPTPLDVCLERNKRRPDDRRVPEALVRRPHAAMTAAAPGLHVEGFDHVVSAQDIDRLRPLLRRVSNRWRRELGLDGSAGLGDELLLRRFFGPELARLFTWTDNSPLADGDRIAELVLGSARLTLAFRQDVDDTGDFGFDAMVPCPTEDCPGPAWVPVFSQSDLLKAHLGHLDDDEDLQCPRCEAFTALDDATEDEDGEAYAEVMVR